MKRKILLGVVWTFLFTTSVFGTIAEPNTQIWYETTELGLDRWQYVYDVKNISLPAAIEEFTIWFDYGLYDNLAVVTPGTPANWDQIVWQPEPVLQDDGGYDALALSAGIGQGQTVGGFSVSFDWLGVGQPGSQFYEVIDPGTFVTIDSGMTIPEPGMLLLLGLGAVMLKRKRRHG